MSVINTNALDIFTLIRIALHPIPLPSRGEGWVRGPHVKKLNAFVLVDLVRERIDL
jgi:hypothetical protein